MRIGVPPSSVNCLDATGFFPFDSGADAMRVPRPAAGMMATTFMAGCKYTRRQEPVQIRLTKGVPIAVTVSITLAKIFLYGVFCSLRELLARRVLLTFLKLQCFSYNSSWAMALGVTPNVNGIGNPFANQKCKFPATGMDIKAK